MRTFTTQQHNAHRFALALLILAAAAGCSSSHSDDSSAQGSIVVHGLMFEGQPEDVVVGKQYRVEEGMTDQGQAVRLVMARMGESGDPRHDIEAAYQDPSYRHYGGSGEQAPPLCEIVPQDSVDIDSTSALNFDNPTAPITCTLADGSTLYVTNFRR